MSQSPNSDETLVYPWGFTEAFAQLDHPRSVEMNGDGCALVEIDDTHRAVIGQWDDTRTFRAIHDFTHRDRRQTWYANFVAVGESCLILLSRRGRRIRRKA